MHSVEPVIVPEHWVPKYKMFKKLARTMGYFLQEKKKKIFFNHTP
jgi:hypothetical protein